jgi:hypothetical protein
MDGFEERYRSATVRNYLKAIELARVGLIQKIICEIAKESFYANNWVKLEWENVRLA